MELQRPIVTANSNSGLPFRLEWAFSKPLFLKNLVMAPSPATSPRPSGAKQTAHRSPLDFSREICEGLQKPL